MSEGDFHYNGLIEGGDCFDTSGWLADQSWSNCNIGMTGVSDLACIQYLVAPLRPPALAAINPWGGFSDWYREFAYHGGIPRRRSTPSRARAAHRFSGTSTTGSTYSCSRPRYAYPTRTRLLGCDVNAAASFAPVPVKDAPEDGCDWPGSHAVSKQLCNLAPRG